MDDRRERPGAGVARRAAEVLERAVWLGSAAAVVSAWLVVGRNGLIPGAGETTFGLVFWRTFSLVYALPVACVAVSAWLVSLWRPAGGVPRALAAVAALGVLAVWAGWNLRGFEQLLRELEGPARVVWGARVAVGASVAAVVLAGALPLRRRWALRVVAMAALAASWVGLRPRSAEPPELDPRGAAALRLSGQRLLVIGVDGADWAYLGPLIDTGELPHFARLRERGAWGPLATFKPTQSPVIWTTIATGRPPEVHGIRGFTRTHLEGVDAPLGRLKPIHGLGFDAVLRRLKDSGAIRESPISSVSRRVPALWNLATAQKSPIDVLNWWATWPAEPVLGHVVSERLFFWRFSARGWDAADDRLTYPPELIETLMPHVVRPEDVDWRQALPFMDVTEEEYAKLTRGPFRRHQVGSEFPYAWALFRTNRALARLLMDEGRHRLGQPSDLLILTRLVDMSCHTSLRVSDLVDDHLGADPDDVRRFGRVVRAAYRATDDALGELVEEFGPGNVVVLSDHGFTLERRADGSYSYDHLKAPPGVFLAAGPAFRPGRVEDLDVFDVLPLLAAIKGFPVADDLSGQVPEAILSEGFLDEHPLEHVASYGSRSGEAAAGSAAVDAEMIERLEALGYLQ